MEIKVSEKLFKILKESEGIFNRFIIDANTISNDIRAVESFLTDKSVNISFDYTCYEDHDLDEFTDYVLSWRKYKDVFRLVYFSKNKRYSAPNDDIRPLIDTKLETRREMHKYLEEFIKRFRENIC